MVRAQLRCFKALALVMIIVWINFLSVPRRKLQVNHSQLFHQTGLTSFTSSIHKVGWNVRVQCKMKEMMGAVIAGEKQMNLWDGQSGAWDVAMVIQFMWVCNIYFNTQAKQPNIGVIGLAGGLSTTYTWRIPRDLQWGWAQRLLLQWLRLRKTGWIW